MAASRSLLVSIAIAAALAGCDRCSGTSSSPTPSSSSSSTSVPAPSASTADPMTTIRWDDTPLDWTRPLPVTPPGGLAVPGYVAPDACKACHTSIFDSFARHSMAKTGLRPLASLDKRWLAKIFDAGAKQTIRHERSGYSYRPYREGDRYFVEELIVAADGARVHSWVQPITHAFSAGGYGMAFYFRQGARFFHVPIDYFAKVERWDLDPAASKGNPRFSTSIETFCISCHGEYPRRRAGTNDVFVEPLPAGVGCDRCHGPGEKHARSASAADILNPAHLTPVQQLDVCSQCHQSSLSTLRAGRHDFSYRPGEPLDAYRVNFLGEPAEPDRFALLAHSERMVQSKCWKGSKGKLGCTSCHDPHKSSFEQPAAWWDAKCNACHEERKCTADAAARAVEKDHCVRCHMRAGSPTSPTLVTVTDHWIQRRPPPIRAGEPTPESFVSWSEAVGVTVLGDDLPAVEAVAYAHAGKTDQALRLALGVMGKRPRVTALYEWLAGRFEERREPWNMARALTAVLRYEPDARKDLLGYANVMLEKGTPDGLVEAMHALDREIAIDPDDGDALDIKGVALFRDGKIDDARPLLVRAVAASPTVARSHVALAALALRDGKRADAIAHFEAARHIEPSDGWIMDKLRDAYAATKDTAHAAAVERARAHFVAHGGTAQTYATRWLPPTWQ